MYIPKIDEKQLPMTIITMFSTISTVLGCSGKTMLRLGLNEYEKQAIVDMHNRIRQSVALGQFGGQPAAENMMELKWDNDLASNAQDWTTTCSSRIHDERRHNSRFYVGQNIASRWTTKPPATFLDVKPDFDDAISRWFHEAGHYSFGKFRDSPTGHYSQMIWANTASVGCGFAFYFDPARGFTKKYVCNYGPSGNVYGEEPYKKGYPNCYAYGLTESRRYPGLCDKGVGYIYDFSNYIG